MSNYIKSLLIVAHTPSENTRGLATAILEGAQNQAVKDVNTKLISPFECDSEMVLNCDALILFTTENFGYMSGALKDFFERVYYPCLDAPKRNEAKPFALVIRAGLDGNGADTSIKKIVTGLKWRQVQEATIFKGTYDTSFEDSCRQLGLTIAASIEAGII
jgi:multimeric flavodoxin WrbA